MPRRNRYATPEDELTPTWTPSGTDYDLQVEAMRELRELTKHIADTHWERDEQMAAFALNQSLSRRDMATAIGCTKSRVDQILRENALKPSKDGGRGTRLEVPVASDPTAPQRAAVGQLAHASWPAPNAGWRKTLLQPPGRSRMMLGRLPKTPGNGTAHRRVRVLVGDDHPLFLEALVREIKVWPEFELVGAVSTDALLPSLRELQPDVTVFDPTFLDDEARKEVFACANDETRLLFVSDDYGNGSYEAATRGAVGCLTRMCDAQELRHAVAAASRGDVYLASAAVEEIAAELRLRSRNIAPYLSPRQREVLQLVGEGRSNKEVATRLTISEATIKAHLRSIYKELEVRNRVQAIAVGLRHHLIN